MLDDLSTTDMLLRAGVASILGGAIGWDRERRDKAAGLRTMMLVSLGAAGVMMAAIMFAADLNGDGSVQLDPLRVISGIIGGIGFLGAGSILHAKGQIRGMTTAATIWSAAGIGIASGIGQFALAGVLTGFVLVMLVAVSSLKGTVLPERDKPAGPGDDDD